ncbi:MAG: DUF5991 domain-containing protein [Ignavibacteria bacterium]|nr:DUF5991 domain-containing protein [Ignavibacteria bacterium]
MKKIFLTLICLFTVFFSCSKKEDQSIHEQSNINLRDSNNAAGNNSSKESLHKWLGKYEFSESAEGLTKGTAQSWDYSVVVEHSADSSVKAKIEIDGFQTMQRIEAEVKADDKKAEFIFSKYLPDNMFEVYRKGDRLFILEINDKGEMVTNWDKMKPNVKSNQSNGKVMFRRLPA